MKQNPKVGLITLICSGEAGMVKQAYLGQGTRVLHTAESGAIRVDIKGNQIEVRSWLDSPWK